MLNRERMYLAPEGGEGGSGGGAEPPAPTQSPPPVPKDKGIDPDKYANTLAENARLQERLAALEAGKSKAENDKTSKDAAKRLKELEAELAATREREAAAATAAKREAVARHLSGIKSEDYLRLAPEVTFGEDGKITADSLKALDEFRSKHPDLFSAPRPGTSPRGAAGGRGSDLSDEDVATLQRMRLDPSAGAKHKGQHPYAHLVGYVAPVAGHRGVKGA